MLEIHTYLMPSSSPELAIRFGSDGRATTFEINLEWPFNICICTDTEDTKVMVM